MSICEDHPFNVENLLHPKLMSLDMPHRDACWSTILAGSDSEHPIYRIIDWSLDGSLHVSSGKSHELAALVLAWSFSTTDRNIRDRATKSLVALIENKPTIFPWLVDEFKAVDDLYILERIYTAAYGAVCRNLDAEWISSFAETAFNHLFALGKPPLHLLLRDYALGLIEIAKIQNRLPKGIDEQLAYPPYHSSPPRFNLKEEAIKQIADKAGGNQILYSCTVHIGDFANYEIPHATNNFLTVPLTKDVPLTTKEKYDKFKQEVIEPNKEFKEVFEVLEEAQQCLSMPKLVFLELEEEEAEKTIKKREEEILPIIQAAQKDLFASLSMNEKVRYNKEVKPYFKKSTKDNRPTSFDLTQRRLWVAKRAYAYGWNKKLFGEDITGYRYGYVHGRERPTVERIGKKYQWLALSELQCRLADNYWLKDYDNPPQKYDSPLNIGYQRDIDPTIIRPKKIEQAKKSDLVNHIMGVQIDLEECTDTDIDHWVSLKNPGDQLESLVYRTTPDGRKFSVLYEHRCTTENFPSNNGYRRQEFRFISAVIVPKRDRKSVVDILKKKPISNFNDWGSINFTDGPFLLEHPWHSAWHYQKWEKVFWEEDSPQISRTVSDYFWESHLDKALPEGFKVYMPCPWLCKELELRRADETSTTYVDTTGSISAICFLTKMRKAMV
jgi:hypothetical protein